MPDYAHDDPDVLPHKEYPGDGARVLKSLVDALYYASEAYPTVPIGRVIYTAVKRSLEERGVDEPNGPLAVADRLFVITDKELEEALKEIDD